MGEGAVMIVAGWTHLKEWGGKLCYKETEVRMISKRKITHNNFNKTTLNVDQNFPNAREPLQLQLVPKFKLC